MTSLTELAGIIAELKTPARIKGFLQELLTPAEVKELSRRWQIVTMLQAGIPQREIAAKLQTSLCAVTRGSKELQKEKSIFKAILEK
jgi:TrpR family transcriptional regulator, trp operon repressor